MPFPWKKVKSARISRLVNDHLHHSQKRRDGSSLVVETGFPTSLVDLFIKNREKLKKPAKRKRHSSPISPLSEASDPVIAGSLASFPSPLTSPSPMVSLPIAGSPATPPDGPSDSPSALPSSPVLPLPSSDFGQSLVVGSSDGGAFVGAVDAKRAFLVLVKTVLVAFLALGTKRLTVGITISAFVLVFLDDLGKSACRLLRPSSDAKGVLGLMLQRVCLLRFEVVKFDEKKGGLLMPGMQQGHFLDPGSSSPKCFGSRCLNQEIQMVEAEGDSLTRLEEIQSENEIVDVSCLEGRFRGQEMEPEEVAMEKEESKSEAQELKINKARRAKMKLTMKKLIPKKLRGSRKGHEFQSLETCKGDSVVLCDEQEVYQCKDDGERVGANSLSSISSARNGEGDGASGLSASCGSSKVNVEAGTMSEVKGEEIESGLPWRYLILSLIVLLGLVEGRAFALLLTLAWCLLLKLGETLSKSIEVPKSRSFNDKSD